MYFDSESERRSKRNYTKKVVGKKKAVKNDDEHELDFLMFAVIIYILLFSSKRFEYFFPHFPSKGLASFLTS